MIAPADSDMIANNAIRYHHPCTDIHIVSNYGRSLDHGSRIYLCVSADLDHVGTGQYLLALKQRPPKDSKQDTDSVEVPLHACPIGQHTEQAIRDKDVHPVLDTQKGAQWYLKNQYY